MKTRFRQPLMIITFCFSQTKAITTVAFMTLVDKGLVSINDPVSKFFPEIPDRVVTKVNEDGTYETRPVKSPMDICAP